MPHELQIQMATQGEPTWVVTDASAPTLRNLLQGRCGELDPAVEFAIQQHAANLNRVSLDEPLEDGVAVALPFCLPLDRNVKVEVQKDDTVEGLLKKYYGVFGPDTKAKTFELNAAAQETQETFFRNLQIGQQITLPFGAPEQVFTPISDNFVLPDAIETLASPNIGAAINASIHPTEEQPNTDPFEYGLVESVDVASANADSSPCVQGDGTPAAYDVDLVHRVYEWESSALIESGEGNAVTLVGIVDTGLATSVDSFFAPMFLSTNSRERGGVVGIDDDIPANQAIDDVYGVNLNQDPARGDITPYANPDNAWKHHGTRMASLLVGGPGAAEKWGDSSPIRLRIVNFASSKSSLGMVAPGELSRAVEYLRSSKSKVVNMSLSSPYKISGISGTIEESPGILFVVAAGNKRIGKGDDLGLRPVYPARFGGRAGKNQINVITVGAHGKSGARAPFSHYSTDFVDIFAPGCGVDTLDGDGQVVADSGTSPAAATVSFAAALVHALGVTEPKDIKNRLIASVDYDEARLKNDAWGRGRLNIAKAISLRRDVMEMSDGSLTYGKVADRKELLAVCSQVMALPAPHELFKVVLNIERSGSRYVDYWVLNDEVLSRVECQQASTPGLLRLADGSSVDIQAVRDVTFHWR
ncbi:S8 family serine peptidase [Ensifer adhaerens]|uniref:S8 family serine peptidase n=1 Tax=Ensifer adhaerens TaxID=106592 RepID=UPI00384B1080